MISEPDQVDSNRVLPTNLQIFSYRTSRITLGAKMATLNHVVNDALNVLYPKIRARLEQTPATLTTVNQDVTQLTTDSVTPTPSQTSSMVGSPPSGGPTSSPLLFFVALGFGVVFTNLWSVSTLLPLCLSASITVFMLFT